MLEVVEHEQQATMAQVAGDKAGRIVADFTQAKPPRYRRQDESRVGNRGERDKDDAVSEGATHRLADGKREPGLADPSGAS